jgi:hypothetical protein
MRLITNSAFSQALTESITKSRTFSKVVEDQSQGANYLNIILATEGAARNNIAQGLGKISRLNLQR